MFYRNRIKEAIQNSGFAIGTFVQIGSAENAEIAAAIGFDFIILDMEHGSFGIDVLVNMIRGVQLAGSMPIVRLPDDSETGILKALDAGAGYTYFRSFKRGTGKKNYQGCSLCADGKTWSMSSRQGYRAWIIAMGKSR